MKLLKNRVLVVAAVIMVICLLGYVSEQVREALQCRSQMGGLLYQLRQSNIENLAPPEDIVALATRSPGIRSNLTNQFLNGFLICPGSGTRNITLAEAVQLSDYVYVNWHARYGKTNIPAGYPLIYDKSMDSHWGMGVNVATTDGATFWDFRARWLRRFAAEHPEYNILLPR